MKEIKPFIESLRTADNSDTINTILNGYDVINEGFASNLAGIAGIAAMGYAGYQAGMEGKPKPAAVEPEVDPTTVLVQEYSQELRLPDSLVSIAVDKANKHGIEPSLVVAVLKQESQGKVSAVSHKGARGPMQLMPKTAEHLGVNNISDPEENIDAGAKYIAQLMKRFGSQDLALAAYNAGPGNVRKAGDKIPDFPETQKYVREVSKYKNQLDQIDEEIE